MENQELKQKKEFKISFSQYSAYLGCQHKWFLQYVLKLPGEDSPEFLFGKIVHGTIETIIKNRLLKKLYLKDKEGILSQITRNIFKKELSEIKNKEFVKKCLEDKLDIFFPANAKKLLLELDFFKRFDEYSTQSVEYKLDQIIIYEDDEVVIKFKGYIDLILKSLLEEKFLILDWKTSMKKWDIEKKETENKNFYTQLLLYKFFYSEIQLIELKNINVAFYNLPRDNAKDQLIYPKEFSDDYVKEFVINFKNKCYEIFLHKESMLNYSKIKFITPVNYCSRCQFNNEKFCNDLDEFQQILITEPI